VLVPAKRVSFDQAMGAIVSNSRAGDFDVTIVIERRMGEALGTLGL